jgi:hypothetical protein
MSQEQSGRRGSGRQSSNTTALSTIVLRFLILALGKFCQQKGKLHDAVRPAQEQLRYPQHSPASGDPNSQVALPGFEYFAMAPTILGNHTAGRTLKHVWADILAGLFQAQLTRPFENFAHYHAASSALLEIIRP